MNNLSGNRSNPHDTKSISNIMIQTTFTKEEPFIMIQITFTKEKPFIMIQIARKSAFLILSTW
jgi:hypothetical protein